MKAVISSKSADRDGIVNIIKETWRIKGFYKKLFKNGGIFLSKKMQWFSEYIVLRVEYLKIFK